VLPSVPEWSDRERLAGEKEVLGLYLTGHPLDQYAEKIKELATHAGDGLEGLPKGTEVTLCGLLTGIQRRRNREGKPWASMQLEDRSGTLEALVFTTNYERLSDSLVEDCAVRIRGLVLPEENAPPKVSVQDIVPLEVARVSIPTLIAIRVPLGSGQGPEASAAEALRELFARKPGETEVRLRLERAREFSVLLDLPQKVRADREFCQEVERICGREALEVLGS
jgi:DNA polymerase-3 subunit alpha